MTAHIGRLLSASLVLMALAGLASPRPARAATLNVPGDYPTIQAAISAAVNGDTILVAPGTYVETISFLGKAITVASAGGPAVTIIDGNHADSVATFASGEGPTSVLSGFTLRNGRSTFSTPGFGDGGGVRINSASPTITGNRIVNNQACEGPGISIRFGSPLIQQNLISGNTRFGCTGGTGGGGIGIVGSSTAQIMGNTISNNSSGASGGGIGLFAAGAPTIRGNVISGNTAASEGGGISMGNQSDALIVGNLITANAAGSGGGIYWLVPAGTVGPRLVNNTIANNDSPQGSGIFADGFDASTTVINNIVVAKTGQTALVCGSFNDLNPPILRFNNVFSLSGTAYGGTCGNPTGMNGNISANPAFANPSSGDYHLSLGSPSIDSGDSTAAGLPATDLDGDSRILGTAVDMGADEFNPSLPNQPPVAQNLSAMTSEGTAISMTLLATDPDFDPVTFSIVAGPANGTLSAIAVAACTEGPGCLSGRRSSVTYTPAANFNGSDSFTYKANDGEVDGNVATAAITVTPVNDPPTISDIPDQMTPDNTPIGPIAFTVGDPDTPAASLMVTGSSSNTTLVPNANIRFGGTGGNRTVTITPAPNTTGSTTITVTVSDGSLTASDSFVLTVSPAVRIVTGAGAGGGPHVRGFFGTGSPSTLSFFAYSSLFAGGVRVALGDVNGDGIADIVTAPGPGGGPHVRVFSGANPAVELASFLAYSSAFTGGVYVAAGDVDGDGIADIVTGADAGGGPHVRVFSGANPAVELASFFAYSSAFTGGVRVAVGDVNGDGKADIITTPGPGGGPHVRVFSGANPAVELASFFAYSSAFTGGVYVAAGDVDGDGIADIVTGADAGGGPHVRVFSGANPAVELASFFAYSSAFTGGVFVAGSGH